MPLEHGNIRDPYQTLIKQRREAFRGLERLFLVNVLSGNQERQTESLNRTEKNALRVKPN